MGEWGSWPFGCQVEQAPRLHGLWKWQVVEAEWWAAWGLEAGGEAGVQGKVRECPTVPEMWPRDSRGQQNMAF